MILLLILVSLSVLIVGGIVFLQKFDGSEKERALAHEYVSKQNARKIADNALNEKIKDAPQNVTYNFVRESEKVKDGIKYYTFTYWPDSHPVVTGEQFDFSIHITVNTKTGLVTDVIAGDK